MHQNSLQKAPLKHLGRQNKLTQNRSELLLTRYFQGSHVNLSEEGLEFFVFDAQIWDRLKESKRLFRILLINFNGLDRFVDDIHIFTQVLTYKELFNLLIWRLVGKSKALSYKMFKDHAFIYLRLLFDFDQSDNNLFDDLLEDFRTLTLLNYVTHQNFKPLAGKFDNFCLIWLIEDVDLNLVLVKAIKHIYDLFEDLFWLLRIIVNQLRNNAIQLVDILHWILTELVHLIYILCLF